MSEGLALWPPPRGDLRRLRRRLGGFFGGTMGLLAGGAVCLAVGLSMPASVGYEARLQRLLGPSVAVAVGAIVAGVLFALLVPWSLTRAFARARPALALEDGEVALVFSLGAFLDRVYRAGFFAITDRRLLRLEESRTGWRQATLATRDELASIDLAFRRSTRHVALNAFLTAMGVARGLHFTLRDGRGFFFVLDDVFLDRLVPWLEANVVPVGHRDDADDAPVATPLAPVFVEHRRHSRVRRWLPLAIAGASLLFCAGAIAFTLTRPRRPPIPTVLNATALPALSKRRLYARKNGVGVDVAKSDVPPPGAERILARFIVMTAGSPRRMTSYEVVRVGGTAYLRETWLWERPEDGAVESRPWEPLPGPDRGDAAYEAAARALLEGR